MAEPVLLGNRVIVFELGLLGPRVAGAYEHKGRTIMTAQTRVPGRANHHGVSVYGYREAEMELLGVGATGTKHGLLGPAVTCAHKNTDRTRAWRDVVIPIITQHRRVAAYGDRVGGVSELGLLDEDQWIDGNRVTRTSGVDQDPDAI